MSSDRKLRKVDDGSSQHTPHGGVDCHRQEGATTDLRRRYKVATDMHDFSNLMAECDRAPRLNELAPFFSATASGQAGMPIRKPEVDRRLLSRSAPMRRFIALHASRQGPFDQHYLSSIPYRYEEECRLGCAILSLANEAEQPLTLYSLGTAEGTMARTVSELANGRIRSLSCSPNVENEQSFHAYGKPQHAEFFCGPFHHLTRDVLDGTERLRQFADGFDVIMEDTTFQMYSPNRGEQIAFVAQNLRRDGIMILVEKFRHDDVREYHRREQQKDHGFKTRYFSESEIAAKTKLVLTRMNENEVTLDEIGCVLRALFCECFITWNSGNFYTLVASNDPDKLKRFLKALGRPAIPLVYSYGQVPRRLHHPIQAPS